MLNNLLYKSVDNSPLIVFRIIFGFLIAAEAWGAIFTGWIKRTLIEPEFTFNFIGFDFFQPLTWRLDVCLLCHHGFGRCVCYDWLQISA